MRRFRHISFGLAFAASLAWMSAAAGTLRDAAQYVTNDRTLAWSLAFGYSMHAGGIRYAELRDDPAKRAWLEKLARVQREVVSRYALRKLVGFEHDRSDVFRTGNDPTDGVDDGCVRARYDGGMTLTVNLGPIRRTCFGTAIGPYGWLVQLP